MKHVFLFLFIGIILSVLFSSGQIENPDTHLRLTQTRILIDDLKFGLPSDVGENTHGNIAINKSGERYMVYNPGQTLLFIPVYLIAKFISASEAETYYRAAFFVSFINFIINALCALLLFNIALSLNASEKKALFVSLVFCLTSYSFSFAQSTYEHHFEMFFMLLAFYYATKHNIKQNGLYAGLAICIGLLFRSTTVLIAPAIVILLSTNKQRLYFMLTAIMGVFFVLVYNNFRFANPLETGYGIAWKLANGNDIAFWSLVRVPKSIFGFLFSPGKGLLFFSPTILLSLIGVSKFWSKNKKTSISILITLFAYLFLFSMNFAWHGSIWSFGPRYILPIIPLLYLPLIEVEIVKRWIYPVLVVAFISQVLVISVNYKRDVLEEYVHWNGIDEEEYIYNINKIPYITQAKQFAVIFPKNFSGELKNFFPDSPWKKEIRIGDNHDVLESSIEKNAINFWWVRVFLLSNNIYLRIGTVFSLLISLLCICYIIKYLKRI